MTKKRVFNLPFKGVSLGKAVIYSNVELDYVTTNNPEEELKRYSEAFHNVLNELETLAQGSDIFQAHCELIQDPMIDESVSILIEDGQSAFDAVNQASVSICQMFSEIDDEYLRARVDDVRDIFERLSKSLCGVKQQKYDFEEGTIIVAKELFPSDTVNFDFSKIVGLITERGSVTSHVSIIARNYGIPAVVGLDGCLDEINEGDVLILDGELGEIVIDPDEESIKRYEAFLKTQEITNELDTKLFTKEGKEIKVYANAGSIQEVELAIRKGADGIGLFRSEFLYMKSLNGFPSEEFQYEQYKASAKLCEGNTLTIRTLDIGGDKMLPYASFEKEENPFLGVRGIRYSYRNQDIFITQLRAILRASGDFPGVIRIMFPMISAVDEFLWAKKMVVKAKESLHEENLNFDSSVKVGLMIETPAAVIMADKLSMAADFFSIGSNDLVQYLTATDRGNPALGDLGSPMSEAVKRSLVHICTVANKAKIPVGICGEIASESWAIEILLEAGIDSFSVGPALINSTKQLVQKHIKYTKL